MATRSFAGLLGLLLLAACSPQAVFAQPGGASGAGGQMVCYGEYALCSSAPCTDDPNSPGGAICDCEIPPEGLNVGNSSCESRGQQLTSTFSLWDITKTAAKPAKRSLGCEGANATAWAFCLDSTCKRTASGGAQCSCKLAPASSFYTLGGGCDEAQCTAPTTPPGQKQPYKYWSGATLTEFLSGYDQLWVFHEKIPKLNFCQP